jgi:hypothetical protein
LRDDGMGVEAKKVTDNYVARRAGAPTGNKNAWKHGRRTAASVARRRETQAFLRPIRAQMLEAKLYLAELQLERQLAKFAPNRITNAPAAPHPQDVDTEGRMQESVQEKRAALSTALSTDQ